MAYIHVVASPNEVQLSATLYYRIKIESRGETNIVPFKELVAQLGSQKEIPLGDQAFISQTVYLELHETYYSQVSSSRYRIGVRPVRTDDKCDICLGSWVKIHKELIGAVKFHQIH
jgi:hypothetical protein